MEKHQEQCKRGNKRPCELKKGKQKERNGRIPANAI